MTDAVVGDDPDTGRLEAFSDGVFAIAITLLVLELREPDDSGHGLWSGLVHEWPQFAAYVTTFIQIGIMWINHHSVFKQIRRTDRTLLFLNLLLLFAVSLLPFPTALVSHHLGRSDLDSKVAEAAYSSVLTLAAIAFSLLWAHAVRDGRLLKRPLGSRAAENTAIWRFSIGSVLYALTIGVAFLSPPVALAIQFALAAYYVFEQIRTRGIG